MILLDTSVIIDFYRKQDKSRTFLMSLVEHDAFWGVSVVTEWEILSGSSPVQDSFWESFFTEVQVIPFTREAGILAANHHQRLRKINQAIAVPDLFIAATGLSLSIPVATLNEKHFSRISGLPLLTPSSPLPPGA